ncbi:tRNA-(ms[2]io[6]A)-hydroxylase [Shewanella sp. VB17]|uniref:tRNA-(ms[2]io[6]A)-hydroxylase n=1 Tax=Shewanella sp. VB17 TaxID=2739432 RepID=UPI0015645C22|nr:tRNA-(ms[2]io[6]A)-hydroxylase [Shewanella sp. VB17]NRD75095.1 tRNA-(ms[2]io[6]A)-hydroxylase [Shewanella sp. VB17]
MSFLRYATPPEWVEAVLDDFDTFLFDHAAAEKKASGMAISMISHYPDKTTLVEKMIDLSIEELCHYREVIKLIHERGRQLNSDSKDEYVNAFRGAMRKGGEAYFLDRLIIGAIIEARGAERFALIAKALPDGKMKSFYLSLSESESRHYELFLELAALYFESAAIDQRVDELLDIEATICASLPIRSALH